MKRIVTVIGARPQFIKASVVSACIREGSRLRESVVHTGQHYDANMSDVFFRELGMTVPAHHLGVGSGTHGAMTGEMLAGVERILLDERPDAVLVYGDTNSTLAGALAASKLHIPVAHVEAGLRSYNRRMPEEINRVLTDHVAEWLFTPTVEAERNLQSEGIEASRIIPVGDVMYDVAIQHGARARSTADGLRRWGISPGQYVLATIHRAENTEAPERLAAIVEGLALVAADFPVLWPVHPRTRSALDRMPGLKTASRALMLTDPVGYLDMVQLECFAGLIATDSGGVQKEAFFHGVPCVTLRDETEWVELVTAGWNRLAPPTDAASVQQAIRSSWGTRGADVRPYGNGDAARRLADALADALR